MTANAFLITPINKLCEEYDVYLIVNGDTGELSSEFDESLSVILVRIERKIMILRDLQALYKLIRIFKSHDFDLIQSVTPKAGLLAMIAAYVCRVKNRIHIFTGQVWATKTGYSRRVFKQIDSFLASLATEILVDSESQKNFLVNEKVVPVGKAHVLGNGSISGVNLERFKFDITIRENIREQLSIKEEDNVFLFLGRLNRDKGVLDLASAFAAMENKDSHLLFVGPDEEGIRTEIEQILVNYTDKVHFIGFSTKPEHYMSSADILCLPSYREGFGSVVVEAAAVGIPTIGSRIYGIEDAIVDESTGLLFEVKNWQALQACMERIVLDKVLLNKLGSNAKKRAEKMFSNQFLAGEWLSYYKARL
jgi:glycosyltransferase involved in cell wall biosynthesis